MPNVLVSTKGMNREAWLKQRRKGIGGSDAAKVLGISRWGGPLSVYMEKKGLYTPDEPGEAAYWGTVLEDVVAREFEKQSGLKVRRENKIFFHPDHPWMIADIDRRIVGENAGLECKTTSSFMGEEWKGDELPDSYYVQIQHYIAVMGWEICYVAVLIGGQRFLWKPVVRNDSLILTIIEKEREFWEDHFMKDVPPPIGINDDPAALWPKQADDLIVSASDDVIATARALKEAKARAKDAKRDEEMLAAQLKVVIGEHEGIEGVCTWKQNKTSLVTDWELVARELKPDDSVIRKHSKEQPGARVLKFNKNFDKEAI